MKKWIEYALMLVIVLAGIYLFQKYRIAPEIDLTQLQISNLQGQQLDLQTDANLLVFFATWCGPCRTEFVSLNALQKELKDELRIISISDEDHRILEVFKSNDMSVGLPLYQISTSFKELGIHTVPTSYLVDKHGTILMKKVGVAAWDSDQMKTKILDLLD